MGRAFIGVPRPRACQREPRLIGLTRRRAPAYRLPSPMALICAALRTPFGRHGGALASVRTDDLAALPIRALIERLPRVDWAALDEVILGCANQAGEDNRNVARMAVLLAGLPASGPRRDREPAVRLGPRGRGPGGARDRERGGRARAGGRRREHVALALRARQGRTPPFARDQKLEDTTLGWRFVNPAMRGALRHRLDDRDGREPGARGRQIAREDQDAFALRSQQRAERARGRGRLAEEIVPVTVDGGPRDPRRRPGRAAAARHDARGPGAAQAAPRAGHDDHRRQRLRPQRRRGRRAARVREGGRTLRARAARPRRRDGERRSRAARDGAGAGAGDPQAAGAPGAGARGLRGRRDQRSVRGAGALLHARARPRRRRRAREPERRRDRARPPARRERRAAGDDGGARAESPRRAARAREPVRRGRPGARARRSSASRDGSGRRPARPPRPASSASG